MCKTNIQQHEDLDEHWIDAARQGQRAKKSPDDLASSGQQFPEAFVLLVSVTRHQFPLQAASVNSGIVKVNVEGQHKKHLK